MQTFISDVYVGDDGQLRILFEVEASMIEGLYLANQIALEDMFIQTASLGSLIRHGEMWGLPQKPGTPALGSLLFAGSGGVFIPVGSEAAFDPGGGLPILYFSTTQEGTIPNPGVPTAPTLATGAGGLLTGTYEYAVTFLTAQGEGLIGATSQPLAVTTSQIVLTNIPIGGPGTVGRNIYRQVNGGAFAFVHALSDNAAVTWADNLVGVGGGPPIFDTSLSILLTAQSNDFGSKYDAVASSITILVSVPDGVTSVINPSPFTGGSDTEETEAYRSRLLLFIRNPQTGSVTDIQGWAQSIDGVGTATVVPNSNLGTPTNGHVTVYCAAPDGSIPSGTVLANVLAFLQAKDLVNIVFHVTSYTPTSVAVTVALTRAAGYTLVQVQPAVITAITNFINSIPVGGTLYLTQLSAAILTVTGVVDLTVSAPASNQVAAASHKFQVGVITIT